MKEGESRLFAKHPPYARHYWEAWSRLSYLTFTFPKVTCLPRDGTDIQSSMDSESCAYFTVPFLDCMGIVSGHWVEQLLDPHFFFILLEVPRKFTADFLASWDSSHIC